MGHDPITDEWVRSGRQLLAMASGPYADRFQLPCLKQKRRSARGQRLGTVPGSFKSRSCPSAPSGNLCKLPHNLGPAGSCWRTFPSVCVRSSFCSLLSRRGDSRALQWRCSAPKLLRYCPAGCRVFSCVGRSGNVFGFFTFEFFSIWALQ